MRIIILWCILVQLLYSCQPESRQADFVVLSTNEVAIEGNTENGVVFSAEILLSKDEPILDNGFVYALTSKPTLGTDVKVAAEEEGASKFSSKMMDALAPDTTYHVRSYAKTQSFLTYGNEVTFRSNGSKAPIIEKIEPSIAFWGDTILVTGKNFDRSGKNNSVWFGGFEASKRWGTKDTIYAIVPFELNTKKSEVTVKLYGKNSTNSKPFEIHSPVVTSISRTEGQYPDEIIVCGDYFSASAKNPLTMNLIHDGDSYCGGTVLNRKQLSLRVPFIGLEKEGFLSLEIIQQGERLLIKDFFRTNKQSIILLSDSATLSQPIYFRTINLDMTHVPLSVRINNYVLADYMLSESEVEFSFPALGGAFDDEVFDVDLFFSGKLMCSISVKQSGPIIKEIYNQKVDANGMLDFYVVGVDLSQQCMLHGKVVMVLLV